MPVSSVVAGMLISVDDEGLASALGHRNRDNLVLEKTLVYGGYGTGVAFKGKRVLLFSRNLHVFSDQFCAFPKGNDRVQLIHLGVLVTPTHRCVINFRRRSGRGL